MSKLWNIFSIFFPIGNKFTLSGLLLMIVGFFLSPLIVGIPILILGYLMGSFGVFLGIAGGILKFIPGGERKLLNLKKYTIDSYKPYFRKIKK